MEELGFGPNGGLVYCMEYASCTLILNAHFQIQTFIGELGCVGGRNWRFRR